MNTSLSWIKAYVPELDVTAQQYTDAMTLSGTKVEGFERLDADLDKIVIGQIDKIEKHPDADKLIICQVDIGEKTIQIVTGAPNVKEGDKVPVVLDGGRVAGGHDGKKTPGGIKIKKGKLRGIESDGMMCSIEELGSTRDMYPEAPEYGIYIFPEDAVVGESAIKALGLDDVVFEYEITSNRVDCYSVIDITNYVMEEYGQPMHAYDYDTLAGHKIVVRRAENGEKFTTLDGQERTMDDSVLMICDGEKAVGIAGIMGGENSMITDNVKTMMFEAACFDGTNIRLSAKKIGLRTDASGKFEKGLDPNNAQAAINRACQLIEELGAGEVVGGMADVYSNRKEPVRVKFEPERINALLGTNLSSEQMLDYLANVELAYDEESNEIIAPTFRHDIFRTADIAEEVARFYGYDNIPTTLPKGEATTGKLQFHHRVENVAKDIAEFCGFSQGMNYSFESPKVFDKLLIPEDSVLRQAIKISNPLGDDFSIMRTTSLNGMLSSLGYNYSHRNKDVRLYELANIYLPKALPLTELPDERMQFTLGMYGSGDFFVMKGVVEEFLEKAGMHKIPQYDPNAGQPSLHPGRQANILYDGEVIGFLGEVHPQVLDNYGIGEKAYVAVLDMPKIVEKASFDRKYEGIPKFPAVTRDLSMVVPKHVLAGEIEEMIVQRGGKHLESFKLFDIYEGTQIKEGYKSMAYSVVFRAKDKTMEEAEITTVMKKILNGLESMGIELRQ